MNDIETRLRAAFEAASQVISVDDGEPELLLQPRRSHRHVVVWALAAVAAVIVGVAALAVTLRPDRETPQPPARSHSKSVTPRPVVHTGPRAKSCEVRLSESWRHLLTAGRVPGFLQLRTVGADGAAYAVQTSGTTSRLVRIDVHKNVTPVYIAPAGSRVSDVAVDAGWVVMSLIYGGDPQSGGGEAQGSPTGIVAMPIGGRESDAVTVRAGSENDLTIVQPPVISHGVVYWAQGDSSGKGALRAFTLTTRTDRVLRRGMVGAPFIAGGGVYASNGKTVVTVRAGHFAPGYPGITARGRVVESGNSYVWQVTENANWVLRMSDGGPTPVTVLRPDDRDANLVPYALSGHFLFYGDGVRQYVLDWATGTAATLPVSQTYGQVLAAGGTVAVQTGNGAISMIRTADLPALTC